MALARAGGAGRVFPAAGQSAMTKYRAILQYLGTRYSGWQTQPNRRTVQSTVQEALARICGRAVSVVASGRTDTGVHALGQVVHFRLEGPACADRLQKSLNGVLPWDIRVTALGKAPPGFHAQRDAVKKRYEYRVQNSPVLPPFLHGQVLHVRSPLDFEPMREAAALLEGRHDFKGFAAAASRVKDTRRTILLSRLHRRGGRLVYRVEGDGFLHHMVRNIVGTLLEIGRGRRPVSDIPGILASRDRRQAGPTAPPQGLYLVKVWYRRQPDVSPAET